jgi:hypothetical protein
MILAINNPQIIQIITPFGGYVPEQHDRPTQAFAQRQLGEVQVSLRTSIFAEMLKSLRSALGLSL